MLLFYVQMANGISYRFAELDEILRQLHELYLVEIFQNLECIHFFSKMRMHVIHEDQAELQLFPTSQSVHLLHRI